MVLDRSVAKEEWKETLDMLPRDVYTPIGGLGTLCTTPTFFELLSN